MFNYSTQAIINTIRELFPFSEEFLICENYNQRRAFPRSLLRKTVR